MPLKKNNYSYCFFFIVYLLSSSLISSLYYFLSTLDLIFYPFIYLEIDTLITDNKSFSLSDTCIYDRKFPSKHDFHHIPHILACYIFIIIQFKVLSNLFFVLGSICWFPNILGFSFLLLFLSVNFNPLKLIPFLRLILWPNREMI